MPFIDARFHELAFAANVDASPLLKLQSQQKAVNYLRSILICERGSRLLYGPALCGKSTIVKRFVSELPGDVAVAVLDGATLTPRAFLSQILVKFGHTVELQSTEDLLGMANTFAIRKTRTVNAPLIVVENVEKMKASSLRVLSMLATVKFQGRFAIRLVLTGGSQAPLLLKSKGVAPISQRIASVFEVLPFSPMESLLYLHGRLHAFGVERADDVLPVNICDRLHAWAQGLPGLLNQSAEGVLRQSKSLPVSADEIDSYLELTTQATPAPRLIVTKDGQVVEEFVLRDKRVTIGRSSLADIVIYDEYASKFHVLCLLYADALILVDLNSANGTYVNSVRTSSTILRSNDIVSLANHKIKVVNAPDAETEDLPEIVTSYTSRMKTLSDMREQKKNPRPHFVLGHRKGRP